MRVLVAGRNAKILAQAAGTFAADLEIHTATTKAACFALMERAKFDLIVACETLADGSGLEVLSHVAVNTPNTLRIFAARPATLVLLKGELGLFGLFRTLPYPINFRKLWAAINLARSTCEYLVGPQVPPKQQQPRREPQRPSAQPAFDATIRVIATSAKSPAMPTTRQRATPPVTAPASGKQSGANRGTSQSRGSVAPANTRPPQQRAAASATRVASTPAPGTRQQTVRVTATTAQRQSQPAAPQITSGMRAAARYAAAHAGRDTIPAKPTRIPESAAFKRARARRESGRLEPVVSNESLSQLAKLAATSRPNPVFRTAPPGKKRAAFVVGSGVFAATTAAVLTFFMVSANDSVKHPKMPVIASITQPVPNKVFPWQPETQQPVRPFMRSEAPASAVADLQAEAEAESESLDGDPDHPGPPPPYAPPPPSEPPSLESPAQPVDE